MVCVDVPTSLLYWFIDGLTQGPIFTLLEFFDPLLEDHFDNIFED